MNPFAISLFCGGLVAGMLAFGGLLQSFFNPIKHNYGEYREPIIQKSIKVTAFDRTNAEVMLLQGRPGKSIHVMALSVPPVENATTIGFACGNRTFLNYYLNRDQWFSKVFGQNGPTCKPGEALTIEKAHASDVITASAFYRDAS